MKFTLFILFIFSLSASADSSTAKTTFTKIISERETKLEAQYLELFNIEDLNYLSDDPTCKIFRDVEKTEKIKQQVRMQIQKEEMENKIIDLCNRTNWDKFSDNVGHIVDAAKNAFFLESFSGISERATHWALSQHAYDILTYSELDNILSTQCYPGQPYMNLYFKKELIKEDISPSALGTTGGLIAGWYVLKGAGKVVFSPAKRVLVARGATASTFQKIKTLGYMVAAPILGLSIFYTVKERKDAKAIAEVEQDTARMISRIGLEAIFPEPAVTLAAEECRAAHNNIEDAPTDSLRTFWRRSTEAKCQLFTNYATYALNSLKFDDFNRCHPGNSGAAERIEALISELASY